MPSIFIRPLEQSDWNLVSNIYAEGIATGLATFETKIPNWRNWNNKYFKSCRLVLEVNSVLVGFAVLSPISKREVYKGVAEVSIYIAEAYRGQHLGEILLKKLITETELNGFWTLQAGIFSENKASIKLHENCGFRIVGIREKIGQLNGKWYDNHFLERRSKTVLNIKEI